MMLAAGAMLALAAFLGVPLFVVLGASGLLAAWHSGLNPAVLPSQILRLSESPNLLAIPLFTLAGVTLSRGGAPERLVRLFNSTFGWMRGGLAIVAVTACAFFTAFSGASGVTILALGGLLYPMLRQENYPQRFTLGLLTASGSSGLLFPPSLVVLFYAVVAGVGIGQLFLAGIVPGALLVTLLSLYSVATARRSGVAKAPFAWTEVMSALRGAVFDLLLPVGIVAGLIGGYLTATEAASSAAAYALLLETVIHRRIRSPDALIEIFRETAVLVGSLLVILFVAVGLTNLMIEAQVPMRLLAGLEHTLNKKWEFLLLLNGFLLLVGFFMDIFSATMVIVPLILPLARHFGVDPLQLGIIFMANLEVGYVHPPMGMNLFFASQRFGEPVWRLFGAVLPFLVIMIAWLFAITYVPELSLWWRR